MNLSNNRDRFVEGVHVITLKSDSLRSFRNQVKDIYSVNKHTTSLTLWTEKGAARMSKIVDSDEAWSFFEKMEDVYFRPAPTEVSRKQLALMVIEAEDRAEAFQLENKHLNATVER